MNDGFEVLYRTSWQEREGAWRTLLERYADGRQLCNCRESYYAFTDKGGVFCPGGCQASRFAVKDEIAARVLREIKAPSEAKP